MCGKRAGVRLPRPPHEKKENAPRECSRSVFHDRIAVWGGDGGRVVGGGELRGVYGDHAWPHALSGHRERARGVRAPERSFSLPLSNRTDVVHHDSPLCQTQSSVAMLLMI